MALTESQKKNIEDEEQKKLEEEIYRENVKKNLKDNKKGIGCLGILGIIVLTFLGLGVIGNFIKSAIPQNTTIDKPTVITDKQKNSLAQTYCNERSKPDIRAVSLDDYIAMNNAKGETVTLHPANGAYPTPENCKKIIDICLQAWDINYCRNIAERKIWIGMSEDQLILSWGLPDGRNNSTYSTGTHSQWVYGTFKPYVYLEGKDIDNMVVTSWQD